jgi:transposase
MWITRTTRTGAGNTAVQVVRREHQQTIIVKHIGTAHNPDELLILQKQAEKYIFENSGANPLFPELFGKEKQQTIIEVEQIVNRLEVIKINHTFAHTFLSFFYAYLGFTSSQSDLLRDLVIMRIIEPCSKLRSLELLKEYFSISYGRTTMHKKLSEMTKQKETFEKVAVLYAKKHLDFDFSIVFYDVTTLYFESFKEDKEEFRKPGFSKDNKTNQPQIVIGLIVTKEGFPVSYDVFAGNTFEGKTFIPTITKFKTTYNIKTLTVVADAAMISYPNVQSLIVNNLSYIVGGRLANLKQKEIEEINQKLSGKEESLKKLKKKDGLSTRIETERGTLICDFSFKRYLKDKREMDKQITKAKKLLEENKGAKRTKFIKNKDDEKTELVLNTDLIEKTKLLLGMKGYYSNLTDEADKIIIDHYHDLWRVEKAFRIAKSDLEARPIFHHKKENIEAHILIVFLSLCISKSIELLTRCSIQKVRHMIWSVLDVELIHTSTGKTFIKRTNTTKNPMVKFLEKFSVVDKSK